MAVIDDARRVKALMEKARSVMPKLADDAQASGDFSQIDRAQQAMTRLGDLAQKYTQNLAPQDAAPAPDAPAPTPDASSPASDPSQGLNSVDIGNAPPQEPPSAPSLPASALGGGLFPSQDENHTEAAAKGATKGAIEAIQQKPDINAPTKPGQIDLASLHAMINQTPQDDTQALQRSTTYQPQPELKMPLASMDFGGANQDVPDSTVPQDDNAVTGGLSSYEAAMMGRKKAQEIESAPAGPKFTGLRNDVGESEQAGQGPGEIPNVDAIAPKVEQDFKGNPHALVKAVVSSPVMQDASPQEKEFLRRVQMELGARPKAFTITKLLQAFAVGAGALIGAWFTHKYHGQAAFDADLEGKEWDKEKAQIGKEVYGANQRLAGIKLQQEGAGDRTDLTQSSADARAAKGVASKEGIAQRGELDKADRLDTRLAATKVTEVAREKGRNDRLDKLLKAKADLAKMTEKWHPTDVKTYGTLGAEAHDIWSQLHDKELIWSDEGKKKELEGRLKLINEQMQAIAAKYPSTRQ